VSNGKEEGGAGSRGIRKYQLAIACTGYVLTSKKTPKHLVWTNRKTDVEITVKIPHQPASPVLELSAFEIVAPEFQVTLPNVDKFVNFRDLTIHTSNARVAIEVSQP
jgi:hypothetical protein